MRVFAFAAHVVTWFWQKPVHGPPLPVPHTFAVVAPHTAPPEHVPHWTRPPQPSALKPQPFAGQSAIVFFVHWFAPPQMFGAPFAPQISGDVHCGQVTMPPQPSAIGPQDFAGKFAHVFGTHVPPSGPVTP